MDRRAEAEGRPREAEAAAEEAARGGRAGATNPEIPRARQRATKVERASLMTTADIRTGAGKGGEAREGDGGGGDDGRLEMCGGS